MVICISDSVPRVSIVLPTFNRAHIIEEAINAVIDQDYKDWELLILDDCSIDTTQKISQEYVVKYHNIRFHRNEFNIGLPGNRNFGISLAEGELIFFIEDDLIVDKNCLAFLVATYDDLSLKNKVGGVMPRLESKLQENLVLQEKCDPIIFNRFTGEMRVNYWIRCDEVKEVITTHACTLYPKRILIEAGGYAENIYTGNSYREESDLNFRILHKGYKFFYQSKAWALHKTQETGGCHDFSFMKSEYYKIRNHLIFLVRIFKIRAIYMIPLYLTERIAKTTRYLIQGLKKTW